jgi:hypothetical protein
VAAVEAVIVQALRCRYSLELLIPLRLVLVVVVVLLGVMRLEILGLTRCFLLLLLLEVVVVGVTIILMVKMAVLVVALITTRQQAEQETHQPNLHLRVITVVQVI